MNHAIVFDCEYLTADGAMARNWCGPQDPDPLVAQIGAVKLALTGDYAILAQERVYVCPRDRFGNRVEVDPYFVDLTGITQAQLNTAGLSHGAALAWFDAFSSGGSIWSWGKDELTLLGISSYIAGVDPLIPAHRFANAASLLLKAGMPPEDLRRTTSGKLAGYYNLQTPAGRHHDALDDALSVARTLQHLLATNMLTPSDFHRPPPGQ